MLRHRTTSLLPVILLSVCGHAAPAFGSYPPDFAYEIYRAGLHAPANTSSAGKQFSVAKLQNSPGTVVGLSYRYSGEIDNGRDAWIWRNGATTHIGLIGPGYTKSNGYQYSDTLLQNLGGTVAGYSYKRINESDRGRDAWVWNGLTTQRVGLTGSGFDGAGGYRFSEPTMMNSSGQVVGFSRRFATGSTTDRGSSAWVWNGTVSQQLGLAGAPYTSSNGTQLSGAQLQNDNGQVAGYTRRYSGLNTHGQDAWVWNGASVQQIGLLGGVYVSNEGRQESYTRLQNSASYVAGVSGRYTQGPFATGQDSWVWNGQTTVQIGLSGGMYISSTGSQTSSPELINSNGFVAGYSTRLPEGFTNRGRDWWVWNGTSTLPIGLRGGVYQRTGGALDGYQYSEAFALSNDNLIIGYSERYSTSNALNGQDAWVWDGTDTQQIGLTGGIYTGSSGYQFSRTMGAARSGRVLGFSRRYANADTYLGEDVWAWNGTATQQIGLAGGPYLSNTGVQNSSIVFEGNAATVVGISSRFRNASTINNGHDAWVWTGIETRQIGLVGGIHTGSDGYQLSQPTDFNEAGIVTGVSTRIAGIGTNIGQDAWYYDPVTQSTFQPTLSIADSIRASDNYAYSHISVLTTDGFALGYYSVFANGVDPAESHAFVFRPDLGFSNLGALVVDGLSTQGWETLMQPQYATVRDFVVGVGLYQNQVVGSQNVFVMTLIPTPSSVILLGLGIMPFRPRRSRHFLLA